MSFSSVRRLAGLLGAAVLAVGIVGGAFALAEPSADRNPRTAAEVYDDSMTLSEVAEAASGDPGELAPPCPPAPVVVRLKEAGIPFGPCDPKPERGMGVVLPRDSDRAARVEAEPRDTCPAVVGSKGYPDLKISLPCAPGARILDAVPAPPARGKPCLDLTYRAREGEPTVTERLCPGEKARVGGTAVGAELSTIGGE